jgi:hypothetical protein
VYGQTSACRCIATSYAADNPDVATETADTEYDVQHVANNKHG